MRIRVFTGAGEGQESEINRVIVLTLRRKCIIIVCQIIHVVLVRSFGAESFVFKVAIQKWKDRDI